MTFVFFVLQFCWGFQFFNWTIQETDKIENLFYGTPLIFNLRNGLQVNISIQGLNPIVDMYQDKKGQKQHISQRIEGIIYKFDSRIWIIGLKMFELYHYFFPFAVAEKIELTKDHKFETFDSSSSLIHSGTAFLLSPGLLKMKKLGQVKMEVSILDSLKSIAFSTKSIDLNSIKSALKFMNINVGPSDSAIEIKVSDEITYTYLIWAKTSLFSITKNTEKVFFQHDAKGLWEFYRNSEKLDFKYFYQEAKNEVHVGNIIFTYSNDGFEISKEFNGTQYFLFCHETLSFHVLIN